ncbi:MULTISPECIES: hypothetical protein [Mycolicibacterium]|uniref:Minor tail protein n=1 Tax=Mycolicibacterium senegalense TaxID=1796 RepID=A0ABR5G1Z1_9MYCO|nr:MULTISPECIES: hypothetical protein [Mycolicibacterium]KLI04077.1 hypothetical protein AA982_32095 [Mycolicibacterium senegalense]KLO54219.1 hypothetical protein ABW05_24905 [Mycolicibacterium senegalense]OBK05359.1 hypothetical protein A5639_18750 [Mycolicibacterium conceptionense]OMB78540.1 hypothetical protein A5746_08280 [Mycolicibacterium conceptionense]OMB88977.1 hypothetical protein A5741_14420 [Mycolicibacterium conceptionense]
MASEVWAAIIGGAAGLATGTLGSVIAPWVNWGIERRREDRKHMRDLIESWRAGVASIDDEGSDVDGFPEDYLIQKTSRYFRTPWYETLRPHLSEHHRRTSEQNNTSIGGGTPRALKNYLADEVDRIEREWGLRPGDGRKARRF